MAYSPQLLKLPNWMCFKSLDHKQPMNPHNGFPGSITSVNNWGTFGQAKQAAKRFGFGGVSFVLQRHHKIVCIDIDECIHDGVIADSAKSIVNWFNTYTTISASGEGLHLYLFGEIPKSLDVKPATLDKPLLGIKAIEVFAWGKAFAETGQQVKGTPLLLSHDNGNLSLFYKRLGYSEPKPIQAPPQGDYTGNGKGAIEWACNQLALTTDGRNNRYNSLAFWLGQLCGGGQLREADCEPLKTVARAIGLEEFEIEPTFRSGFNSGLQQPLYPKPKPMVRGFRGRMVRTVPLNKLKGGIKTWQDLLPDYTPQIEVDHDRIELYRQIQQPPPYTGTAESSINDLMELAKRLGGELTYEQEFAF